MTSIIIEKITDSHDCDDCGLSFADGANIYLDGVLHTALKPVAYCFDSVEYDDDEIYRHVLRALDMNVVYSSEEGYCRRLILSLGHEIEVTRASDACG